MENNPTRSDSGGGSPVTPCLPNTRLTAGLGMRARNPNLTAKTRHHGQRPFVLYIFHSLVQAHHLGNLLHNTWHQDRDTPCISCLFLICPSNHDALLARLALEILQHRRPLRPDLVEPALHDPTFLPRHPLALNLAVAGTSRHLVGLVVPPAAGRYGIVELLFLDVVLVVRVGDDVESLGFVRRVCGSVRCHSGGDGDG